MSRALPRDIRAPWTLALVAVVLLYGATAARAQAAPASFPGVRTTSLGFERYDFAADSRRFVVAVPRTAEAAAYAHNPVDQLEALAAAQVPLLHVVGDADDIVPVAENTVLVEARYRTRGGAVRIIHKPGVGHTARLAGPILSFDLEHGSSR